MSKKFDIVFDNQEEFLKKHPHFAIVKPTPNYAAIRAVLRSGQHIEGVKLVAVED